MWASATMQSPYSAVRHGSIFRVSQASVDARQFLDAGVAAVLVVHAHEDAARAVEALGREELRDALQLAVVEGAAGLA